MTFEKLSKPYNDNYGPPEEELKYTHESKHYVDWLWWMQGTIVTFACPENREPDGWAVEEAHYFDPSIKEEITEIEDKKVLIRKVLRNYASFMLGFYDEIPKELEESGMIDGCGVWMRFIRIVFPVSLPGIVTAAIMTAILSWNEFLIASSVVSVNAKTLPILISGYISDKGINWGPMSAVSTVIILPMFVFALFTQKYLVRGLTFGAVKG